MSVFVSLRKVHRYTTLCCPLVNSSTHEFHSRAKSATRWFHVYPGREWIRRDKYLMVST